MENEGILTDRSWRSMKGRFLRHIMGNLCKFKVTEAELVEADERATEETGQTWSPMQYYTREEDEQILRYIINHQKFAWVGGEHCGRRWKRKSCWKDAIGAA